MPPLPALAMASNSSSEEEEEDMARSLALSEVTYKD
jgi:hypothetical protein